MDVAGIAAALRAKVRVRIRLFVWTLGRRGDQGGNHRLAALVTQELGKAQDIAPAIAIGTVSLDKLDSQVSMAQGSFFSPLTCFLPSL
jgi:hypothetical protein